MHSVPLLSKGYLLGFYLPVNEGHGQSLLEVVKSISMPLKIIFSSRELWSSSGDLKICKSPFIYYESNNVCLRIFLFNK